MLREREQIRKGENRSEYLCSINLESNVNKINLKPANYFKGRQAEQAKMKPV